VQPIINQWGPIAVIVGGYLLGIYFQNRRIDDLRSSVNSRFDDLRDLLKSEVKRLEDSIGRVDGRVERVEKRLDRIEDRLEHPIVRQP
jgi:predicted nuclease with TOPRIM domain